MTLALLAVAVAVPTLAHDRAAARAARAAEAARVEYAAADIVALARTVGGRLDITRFSQAAPRSGAPKSAFVRPDGTMLDGDEGVSRAFGRAAVRQAYRQTGVATRIGDRLVAVEGIVGPANPDKLLAVAIAWTDARATDAALRADRTQRWLWAGAGWMILAGLMLLVARRTLVRPMRAVASERSFFADAAHELRAPWAVVHSRVARARVHPELATEHLEAIDGVAQRAVRVVDDMLTLARLDAGAPMARELIYIGSLVHTVAQDFEAARPGTTLQVFAADDRTVVTGDADLLQHALRNLLVNAADHGEQPISIELMTGEAQVRIAVTDHGPGILPSERDGAFERFRRGGATSASGSGLGLTITRAIARAHGGEAAYQHSEARPHATFVVTLPVSEPSEPKRRRWRQATRSVDAT